MGTSTHNILVSRTWHHTFTIFLLQITWRCFAAPTLISIFQSHVLIVPHVLADQVAGFYGHGIKLSLSILPNIQIIHTPVKIASLVGIMVVSITDYWKSIYDFLCFNTRIHFS